MDQEEVYLPGQVAERLGISGAGVRRLAGLYEEVYGALPRDARDSRLWTGAAVERLEKARGLVRAGRAGNIKAALRLADGEEVPDPYRVAPRPSEAHFVALVEELARLRAAVERQNALLEEQGQRLAALEAPQESSGAPESVVEEPERAEPRPGTPGAQETSKRRWWRIFG